MCSRLLSNRVACQKIGGKLLDNGAYHHAQVVVLSATTVILFIRRNDFQDFDPGRMKMAQQTRAISSCGFAPPTRKTLPNESIQCTNCR